jgi:demethylmenaquinone methyltransferase/2-methoxy-6-polyprenyl-1,4-benzoquinol methylase
MFDSVAHSYDRTNDLLSFGQARLWRSRVKNAVNPAQGERILDLAAGTGTSSMSLRVPGAVVVAADFSKGMIEEGKRRYPELQFEFADAMALPFEDQSFDAVTISFGLRNVQDHKVALGQMFRVLKPGGRLVICEFSHVKGLLGSFYRFYLNNVLPKLSALASKTPEAYSYLSESINAWPTQEQLKQDIQQAGYQDVRFKNLTFGVVALHTAVRPH